MAANKPSHAQPRSYSQAHSPLPNGNLQGIALGTQTDMRVVQTGQGARILCVADIRGNLRSLNALANQARADYIIHTGDFGFYDQTSLDRIAEKTLRHVAQFSPLLDETTRANVARSHPQASIKELYRREGRQLSELPDFMNGKYKFDVPVYTVWGACEDVAVLEKLRAGESKVPNLYIIDEGHSQLLNVGGVKLRLLGLGGALVMHKLFDNGEGRSTIAGGQGTMWSTLLQMGELIDNANRCYDPTETRVLITHASPAREGLLNQLSVTLKADFSISAGLHFRYGSSYNEFSVNPSVDHYRGKLAAARASFYDVWETVKHEVQPAVADNEMQQQLLQQALDVINKMPQSANPEMVYGNPNGQGQIDEAAFKNMWNFNLADASFGYLVLDVNGGRIATEMRAQGFNFMRRDPNYPSRAGMSAIEANGRGASATQQQQQQQQMMHQQQQQQQQQLAQRTQQRPTGPSAAPTSRADTLPPMQPSGPKAFQQSTQATQKLAAQNATRSNLADRAEVSSPQPEPSPRNAIYVPYVESMGKCDNKASMQKLIFSQEDIDKIQNTDMINKTRGNPHWVVHFADTETMLKVLARSPRPRAAGETELTKLRLSEYRPSTTRGGRGGHQSATWGPRGGAAGTALNGNRSSGTEGESLRGGRGGRGGSMRGRGDGRGRGGRGGRGGAGAGPAEGAASDAKGASGTPAASTPQPASGDAST